nr:immunoglobulin heavy chain junction region [Macaca mulatta]
CARGGGYCSGLYCYSTSYNRFDVW